MTIQTSTQKMLGLTINVLLAVGILLLAVGLYKKYGAADSMIVIGSLLIAASIYITRLYFNWRKMHARNQQPVRRDV